MDDMSTNAALLEEEEVVDSDVQSARLSELQTSKENYLSMIDKEHRLRQNIVKRHHTKNQEMMIFLVMSTFFAMCIFASKYLFTKQFPNDTLYAVFTILFSACAIFCMVMMLRVYPHTTHYHYSKKKDSKKPVPYEEMLTASKSREKDVQAKLKDLNVQIDNITEDILAHTPEVEDDEDFGLDDDGDEE